MAVGQRPATASSLAEPSTDSPLWKTVPSWFLFGELDLNIPVGAHRIMASGAGSRGHRGDRRRLARRRDVAPAGDRVEIILEAARAGPWSA
jgi:hypothetical protein